eukprot:COSAG01_NODE_15379_length_1345_cov_1.355538_2_plen_70_part_00
MTLTSMSAPVLHVKMEHPVCIPLQQDLLVIMLINAYAQPGSLTEIVATQILRFMTVSVLLRRMATAMST